jgi:hypothetical protein
VKFAQNISLLVLLCLIQSSCAKKYGCTDENALNFSEKAELEDHSCTYDKKLYLHWGPISDILWNAYNYEYLEVLINNHPEDTISNTDFSEHHIFVNTILYDLPQITRIQVLTNSDLQIFDGVYFINSSIGVSSLKIGD